MPLNELIKLQDIRITYIPDFIKYKCISCMLHIICIGFIWCIDIWVSMIWDTVKCLSLKNIKNKILSLKNIKIYLIFIIPHNYSFFHCHEILIFIDLTHLSVHPQLFIWKCIRFHHHSPKSHYLVPSSFFLKKTQWSLFWLTFCFILYIY